ncbi:Putative F-box protein At1g49610 [Linum grandiflorum]
MVTKSNRIDRLSDLPDCILHHILSFLDTKSSVETSILSSKWRSVWKYVPALIFSRSESSFLFRSNFCRFVEHVLSLRADRSRVSRVTVDFPSWVQNRRELLDRIVKYAASHGVEELSISPERDNISLKDFRLVGACYQSLKVLNMKNLEIGKTDIELLLSRFQLLETVTLTHCAFAFAEGFANLPRVESLKLVDCLTMRRVLEVIGPKLINLEIVWPWVDTIEVLAPNLRSFTLKIDHLYSTRIDLSKWNLPSLNRANIQLFGYKNREISDENDAKKNLLLDNLFKILHNIQLVKTLQNT